MRTDLSRDMQSDLNVTGLDENPDKSAVNDILDHELPQFKAILTPAFIKTQSGSDDSEPAVRRMSK